MTRPQAANDPCPLLSQLETAALQALLRQFPAKTNREVISGNRDTFKTSREFIQLSSESGIGFLASRGKRMIGAPRRRACPFVCPLYLRRAGVYVGRILEGREAERSSGPLSPKFVFVNNLKTAGQPPFTLEQLERIEWRGQRRGNSRSLPAMRTKFEPRIPDPITVISIRKIYWRAPEYRASNASLAIR
jgi:hypothetical protein